MTSITATAQRTATPTLPLPNLKDIPRRQTLIRKRDDTDLDLSSDTISLNSGKRAKVTFNDNVDVRVITSEKAPEVIREEVRRVLERHAVGDDRAYDIVKEVYAKKHSEDDAPTPKTLKSYTAALLSNVSTLNRSCSDLVAAVLNSEWLGRDENYVRLFLRFLAALSTTQRCYLDDILGMLVKSLTNGRFMINLAYRIYMLIHFQSHFRAQGCLITRRSQERSFTTVPMFALNLYCG